MLITEFKRIILKSGYIIILLVLIIIKIILLTAEKPYINSDIEKYHSDYIIMINDVKGELTNEKEEKIISLYNCMIEANNKYNLLYNKYYNNEISDTEYKKELSQIDYYISNSNIISLIYDEYLYVKDDKTHRYFEYINGWEAYLANDRFDFPLILSAIVLVYLLFIMDYDTGVYQILYATYKGKVKLLYIRILLVFFIELINIVIFAMSEYVFFNLKYSLTDLTIPLKSLISFRNSPLDINLFEALIIIYLIKYLGVLLFSSLSIVIMTSSHNTFLAVIIPLASTIAPYSLFNRSIIRYHILPLGLTLSSGYIRGNCSYIDTNEMLVISQPFDGIPLSRTILLIIISISLLLIFLYSALRKNICQKNEKFV